MRLGSLCTGYGGLDLAAEAVFGATTAWASDIDPGASKIIEHRLQVPNLGDFTTTDWASVEPVEVLTAGWPCQPFSVAGKGKGADDHRAIWPAVARAVRDLRPHYVVLENVAAISHVRTGPELARAAGNLATLGYVGSWRCVRASDVGAPHRRERIFIVAADTRGEAGRIGPGLRPHGAAGSGWGRPDHGAVPGSLLPTPTRANASGNAQIGPNLTLPGALLLSTPMVGSTNPAAHNQISDQFRSAMDRASENWGQYGPAVDRWAAILGRPAPEPTTPGRKGGLRLNPRFVEWMMGLPEGWVTEVPGLSRAGQLKALGNGVVPQQAHAAIAAMIN